MGCQEKSTIISKTMKVLEGKRIFALKICIQIDSVNLDYMWASQKKSIFSAASTESLFKIYLITNISTMYKDSQKVICIKSKLLCDKCSDFGSEHQIHFFFFSGNFDQLKSYMLQLSLHCIKCLDIKTPRKHPAQTKTLQKNTILLLESIKQRSRVNL